VTVDDRIRFGFAETGEVRLHYATAGSGEKLVVLLHGFPEFWYSWRRQLVALSDTYTVVAPDMRGYNLSDRPAGKHAYKIEKVAGDIAGVIRELGFSSAAVIGHDWGASVAWSMAYNHTGLLWKVGSLQVPPPQLWKRNMSLRQLVASWYMFFFQLPWLPEKMLSARDYRGMERALRNTTAHPGVFTSEDIAEYKETWRQPGALTAMLNFYRANILGRFISRSEKPRRVTVPTLFIFGEKDRAILPETVKGVASMIDAPYREHRIPDSGHWVQQEASDEVTQVLRSFLAE
jgi:pimeloyl-ACP methyl ester carboxylesterase